MRALNAFGKLWRSRHSASQCSIRIKLNLFRSRWSRLNASAESSAFSYSPLTRSLLHIFFFNIRFVVALFPIRFFRDSRYYMLALPIVRCIEKKKFFFRRLYVCDFNNILKHDSVSESLSTTDRHVPLMWVWWVCAVRVGGMGSTVNCTHNIKVTIILNAKWTCTINSYLWNDIGLLPFAYKIISLSITRPYRGCNSVGGGKPWK